MKAIINANIIMPDHVIENGVILIENGIIADFGKAKNIEIPKDAEIIDAEHNFVGPGLVDIHTHAAGGYYIMDNPKVSSAELLKHGVTSVLPALSGLCATVTAAARAAPELVPQIMPSVFAIIRHSSLASAVRTRITSLRR